MLAGLEMARLGALPIGGQREAVRRPGANALLSLQWVASIDLAENEDASASVVVRMTDSFPEHAEQVGRRGAA